MSSHESILADESKLKVLQQIREYSLSLPSVTERLSHGAPSFFVQEKKSFLTVQDNHHGDGRFAITCAAPSGAQELLVEAEPELYYKPPYVAHLGWIGMKLDRYAAGEADWNELFAVILQAYITRAPKKLAALLEEEGV